MLIEGVVMKTNQVTVVCHNNLCQFDLYLVIEGNWKRNSLDAMDYCNLRRKSTGKCAQ